VPETCRAKETTINYIVASNLHFTLFHLSDMLSFKNGLKQGDALTPLLFNFALDCAIRRVQINQDGLYEMVHKGLGYADEVKKLGGIIDTTKKKHRCFSCC